MVWFGEQTQMNPTFRLAVEVCNTSAEELQRHIFQHFTDIILQHLENTREEHDFDEIRVGCTLIQCMHKYCSDTLLLIIPQLEEEMQVNDSQMGRMKRYPPMWNRGRTITTPRFVLHLLMRLRSW